MLDQMLINILTLVRSVSIGSPVGNSDPCLISGICNFKTKKKKPFVRSSRKWNFEKADFNLYREKLALIDCDASFELSALDDVCLDIANKILKAAQDNISNLLATVWLSCEHCLEKKA